MLRFNKLKIIKCIWIFDKPKLIYIFSKNTTKNIIMWVAWKNY